MPEPTKSRPRNLERVRINQQRSRDRKRAYTAELERKVKQLEQALDSANQSNKAGDATQPDRSGDEVQTYRPGCTDDMLAKLTHENRVRGDLLRVLGIDTETQDRFIRASPLQQEPSLSHTLMNDHTKTLLSPPDEQRPLEASSQEVSYDLTASNPSGLFDPSSGFHDPVDSGIETDFSTLIGPLLSSTLLPLPSDPTLCSSCSSEAPQSVPRAPSDSTTACSIAFSMVLSNNKRGYKFIDLESRMRVGYQKAMAPDEECRILNKVLFEVLAEIT